LRDRIQSSKNNFYEDVINKSEGVSNFFHAELTKLAKMTNNTNNVYIDYLIKFGWTEALFDIIEDFTPIIRFTDKDVPKLPDISKFKNLNTLIIKDAKLMSIHPSIGKLSELQELLIPNNKLTELPKEIGKLTKLLMINILGNKLETIPEDIKYLDKTNGGSLHRIALKREEIGEANYKKLRELLPSVKM
jgi:Leucine-rich repeat (LRR) protein